MIKLVDLSTTYGGKTIKNPLICASGPPTHTPEACLKAAEAGFAGVVLKTHGGPDLPRELTDTVGWPAYFVTDWRGLDKWRPIPPKKSLAKVRGKKGEKKTPYTLQLNTPAQPLSYFVGRDYIDYANRTKELVGKDCLVVGSIVAFSEDGWREQCQLINETRVDVVELNLSCPWAVPADKLDPELPPGMPSGAFPDVAKRFTELCIKLLDVPVVCKLPCKITDPLASAKACQEAGAQGITWSDSSFTPALRIDIETGQPGWVGDYPSFSTCWGPWVLPYTCGNIANFRLKGIDINLSASGGISDARDVIRCIMAGAGSVQPCRVVMVEGWGVATEWLDYIENWMAQKGYRTIEEMVGLAADRVVTDNSKLPLAFPQILGGPRPPKEIVLEERKCIDCGWCEAACSHLAITMENGLPVFDRTQCEVCGVCPDVCPVGALMICERIS